ncbi:hypothetical protein HIM_08093 [Hirsutella minnesotensis 3608]|uniref:Acyl-CoA thioesterase-like C-terminal domain-containing protein n=1 Tax=Hirsutella minnesotensis 3608 TaxID=1043627 RepID=A0A0F8A3X1_9HYPO|nr:hypothetical protein HIM_08093 [Hirsutella minnesotensis 3608]
MESDEGATLMPPPPRDPNKAPIENTLEVTEMSVLGKDIFTNTRKAWHPPGARGIYGGTVIAQCLAAAQKTVPDAFLVHSCHCYFLLAGAGTVPILFHVERVRDGRYFIGTVVRIHRLWRFPVEPEDVPGLAPPVRRQLEQVAEFEGMGSGVDEWAGRPVVGMQVSLDHSIYFHEPLRVQADDWLFTEMESPWAGDGRGVVLQRIFAKDGTLLATCVQEGVVRLKQPKAEGSSKL